MKGRAVGYVDGPFCEFRESSGSAYAFRGIAFDMIPAPFFLAIANNAQTVIILRMILHKNSVFQKLLLCIPVWRIFSYIRNIFTNVIFGSLPAHTTILVFGNLHHSGPHKHILAGILQILPIRQHE